MKRILFLAGGLCMAFIFIQCKDKIVGKPIPKQIAAQVIDSIVKVIEKDPIQAMIDKYVKVSLTTDTTKLTANEKKMLPLLISVARIMDDIFWKENFGDKHTFLDSLHDLRYREFARLNYGPWDKLNDNKPFIPGYGDKPLGAEFYPHDMTKDDFEKSKTIKDKTGHYSIIRKDEKGNLVSIPYHIAYKQEVELASRVLKEASGLADDPGLKKYLSLRAVALLTDNYLPSDLAWMDMKNNTLDIVAGPIETYSDGLYGYRAAHEAYVLVKDQDWSKRLAKYAGLLPGLQSGIPVEEKYKKEKPGSSADLNAYDVVYYAGEGNTGGKTIAINLPNDEVVQAKKGTRRLQLKNTIAAKFENILKPIATKLISADQRGNINGDAFFANTMFHEVAHGLGISQTINGKGTVRNALKELYGGLEEGKADILGLYMIKQLKDKGEVTGEMKDYIVTFVASIFRSIRFGAADAHAKANLLRFNFLKDAGAIIRNADGTYAVNFEKWDAAAEGLIKKIMQIQGDGDYDGLKKWLDEKCKISDELKADLARLDAEKIPVDIIFDQGLHTLGMAPSIK